MLEKHDELKMSFLSGLYKVREQILNLWMNTASLVLFLGGGLDSISATKYTEEVLHLPQVSHYCSSTVAWKMRMLKGKETVLLHSALDV